MARLRGKNYKNGECQITLRGYTQLVWGYTKSCRGHTQIVWGCTQIFVGSHSNLTFCGVALKFLWGRTQRNVLPHGPHIF